MHVTGPVFGGVLQNSRQSFRYGRILHDCLNIGLGNSISGLLSCFFLCIGLVNCDICAKITDLPHHRIRYVARVLMQNLPNTFFTRRVDF